MHCVDYISVAPWWFYRKRIISRVANEYYGGIDCIYIITIDSHSIVYRLWPFLLMSHDLSYGFQTTEHYLMQFQMKKMAYIVISRTAYSKIHAHGFRFGVYWCGLLEDILPTFPRIASRALANSYRCSSASEANLENSYINLCNLLGADPKYPREQDTTKPVDMLCIILYMYQLIPCHCQGCDPPRSLFDANQPFIIGKWQHQWQV